MPSKSQPQARFMAACAHGAGYASCPPARVSHEFNQADKGSAMLKRAMQRKAMGGPMLGAPNAIQNQLGVLRARMPPQMPMQQAPMSGVPMQMRGPIPPPSARPGMPPGMPPGGALAALRPGMHAPAMPMRPYARGGALQPPGGLGPQAYTPRPSPLASLIGNRFAAMHRGNPAGMRKPRIPLPGALRNINQPAANHVHPKFGSIGLS